MTIFDYLRAQVHAAALRLGADEEGATATEYVFLLVFIAIVAAVGMALLGPALRDIFSDTATSVGGTTVPAVPTT